MSRFTLSTFAVVALAGACADNETATTRLTAPRDPVFSSGIATAGTIQVCIDPASPAATYTIDVSNTSGVVAGDVVTDPVVINTAAPGPTCLDAFTRPTSPSNLNNAQMTLTASVGLTGTFSYTCSDDVAVGDPLCGATSGANGAVARANSAHGSVVTFLFVEDQPPPTVGCTFTYGWYKNQGFGDVPTTSFFGTAKTWQQVITTKAKGNNYYNLAFQYISAFINIGSDTPPTEVADAIADAETFFTGRALGSTSGYTAAQLQAIIDILRNFNEGLYPGWPHCGLAPS